MSKIVKIKQQDIEKIVTNILENIDAPDEMMTQSDDMVIEPTSVKGLDPKVQQQMKSKNLEFRPDTEDVTKSGGDITIGVDEFGNYYVLDLKNEKVLGVKKD